VATTMRRDLSKTLRFEMAKETVRA
jgi:hypothetical protein